MPDRSVKMKRRIFGFQRRVWWPKWTPASSSSRMETTAIGAPSRLVWVVLPAGLGAHRPQRPAPRRGMVRRGGGTGSPLSLGGGDSQGDLEVGRQRGHDVHRLPRERVLEGEPGGMEELPSKP